MNRKLKTAIREAFEPPIPVRKTAFLSKIPQPQITTWSFVLSQAGYIRKRVWIIDFLILFLSMIGTVFLEQNLLWTMSSMTPILAMSVITESGRSEVHGMSELELSARFSLKSVTLARLGILGITNFALFCILIPASLMNQDSSFMRNGIYLTCPYLITTFLCLWISRRIRGMEASYACVGIALLVSIGSYILPLASAFFYNGNYFVWWQLIFLLSIAGTIKEICEMIKQTEELTWNF